MVKIEYTGRYHKSYQKLVTSHPEHIKEIAKRIQWFRRNPFDTRLRNHKLYGHLEGRCAFSITDDIRIVYRWRGNATAQFLDIGGHEKLYRR
ncbi:type II toxin-antitoxin system mRNA interferase toxin, RelE/StbE family [Candidatus Gottesmanbacteria bacterium]|nr:type II toxin-antitoxin system mRNA interferase toxin, RelE/StbE family [Candidatus Gottesmanbacteria bacterium]